jgi:hypothetical protein
VLLNFDAMLDGHEVPLHRRCWDMHEIALLRKILRKRNVVKEQPSINNNSPRDTVTHLLGVCLLVLHAEGVAQNLEDLKHGTVEVTSFPK